MRAVRRDRPARPTVLEDLDQFAKTAREAFRVNGLRNQRHFQRMVKIVRPRSVEVKSIARDQDFLIAFVLRDGERAAGVCRVAQLAQNMVLRAIVNGVGRVEAKTVDVKFTNPIAQVLSKEGSYRSRSRA